MNVHCCRLLLTETQSAFHFQLHNITEHLLYQFCTNCTVCNWTELTAITQSFLLHVQLHNSIQTDQLLSSEMPAVSHIPVSVCIHSVMSLDRTFKLTLLPQSTASPFPNTTNHNQLLLCLELLVYTDSDIHSAGSTDEANRQRGREIYDNINRNMLGLLEGKFSKIQILTRPFSSCVLVCLPFKILNHVTNCYKSRVKIFEPGEHHEFLGFNSRHLVRKIVGYANF